MTILNRWAAKLEESGDTRAAERKREEAEGVSSAPAPDRKKKKPKKRPARAYPPIVTSRNRRLPTWIRWVPAST